MKRPAGPLSTRGLPVSERLLHKPLNEGRLMRLARLSCCSQDRIAVRTRLGGFITKLGLTPILVDNDSKRGGDVRHDIWNDSFFQSLIRRAALGEFLSIIAAPPCSTFSVSGFFDSPDSADGGPPPVCVIGTILRDLPTCHVGMTKSCETPTNSFAGCASSRTCGSGRRD